MPLLHILDEIGVTLEGFNHIANLSFVKYTLQFISHSPCFFYQGISFSMLYSISFIVICETYSYIQILP